VYSRSWPRPLRETAVGRPDFVARHGLFDAARTEAAAAVEAALEHIDLVRVAYCDPHGLARAKVLTAGAFASALRGGMDCSSGPLVFDTGHALAVDILDGPGVGVAELAGAGNFVLVPDPLTFQVLPGEGPRTAWVLGEEYQRDGTAHPLSSRRVLRQVAAAYAGRGLTAIVGLEVEWYLTRRLPGPPGNAGNGFGLQGAAPRAEAMNAGYQFNLESAYDSVADAADPLAARLLALGLPLRSMEHESGPGQLETTFEPLPALDAADAMLLFRTQTKQFCTRRGLHATFMSLPRLDGFDPSGWHLHQSVADAAGRNLFASGEPSEPSAQAAAYIGGLLSHAAEYCMLSVPTVNGYHRLGPQYPLSPTRIAWSTEDRGAMVRVAGAGAGTRLENRTGEPCANPYLLMAAQLSAGLTGLTGQNGTDGTDGSDGTDAAEGRARAREVLPQSLPQALEAFRGGRAAGLLGDPLARCLARLKDSEVSRFEAWRDKEHPPAGEVTEWEQREYFGAF
jgi:glutamine synthetase